MCAGFDNVDQREGALRRNIGHYGRDFPYVSPGSARVSQTVSKLASRQRSPACTQWMPNGHLRVPVPVQKTPKCLQCPYLVICYVHGLMILYITRHFSFFLIACIVVKSQNNSPNLIFVGVYVFVHCCLL